MLPATQADRRFGQSAKAETTPGFAARMCAIVPFVNLRSAYIVFQSTHRLSPSVVFEVACRKEDALPPIFATQAGEAPVDVALTSSKPFQINDHLSPARPATSSQRIATLCDVVKCVQRAVFTVPHRVNFPTTKRFANRLPHLAQRNDGSSEMTDRKDPNRLAMSHQSSHPI